MIQGIDVSHFQGEISFDRLKSAGIGFCISKASQGSTWNDPMFRRNLSGSRAVGLVTGAYHFFDPTHDSLDQAKNFLSQLQAGDFPTLLALDIEQAYGWDALTVEQISQNVQAWLDYVQEHTGQKPLVYTDIAFADQYLTAFPMGNYHLWLAHDVSDVPAGWTDYKMIQYGKGQIDGVPADVDLDSYAGELSDLTLLGAGKLV